MKRTPSASTRWAPSPRTASETSGCWPSASGAEEEHGRVELHELQVGDLGAGAQREGDAVAGGDRRVGGGGEDLAHAAGGEDHGGGVDGADAVVLALAHDVQGDAGGAAVGVRQQVQDERVLDGAQARARGPPRPAPGRSRRRSRRRPRARCGGGGGRPRGSARSRRPRTVVEVGAGRDQPAYGVGALGDEERVRPPRRTGPRRRPGCRPGAARGCRPRRGRRRCRPAPSAWSRRRGGPW